MAVSTAAELTCILNATAGPGHNAAARAQLERLFAEFGTPARVVLVQDGDEIAAQARQAAGPGHPVVAAGGDGTVNAVASTLAGTDAVLGVLPMGTCNHFAKDLGIPLDLKAAVRTTLTGRIATVDVGEVNGQMFLNNSSLGIYPQFVRDREMEQDQGYGKAMALAMAVVAVLRHPSPLRVRLRSDGTTALMRPTPLLFVGNNRYSMERLRMGRRTRLDAGQLWVCMAPPMAHGRLLGMALRALAGRLRPGDLDAREATEFWVETQRRRVEVAWDGEVAMMASPLHYRIRPRALRVMAPG